MDQTQFILAQVQSGGLTLTNIQAFSGAIGIVISTLIMWGLMTKNINEKIKSKADEKATNQRFLSIEKEVSNNQSDYKALLLMQQDTNTKVTEIWQHLAEKKGS